MNLFDGGYPMCNDHIDPDDDEMIGEKYHLILTPRNEHKTFMLPVGLPYAEAITIRDMCLGQIATVPEVAAQWADVDVVHEGWPNVNILGVSYDES